MMVISTPLSGRLSSAIISSRPMTLPSSHTTRQMNHSPVKSSIPFAGTTFGTTNSTSSAALTSSARPTARTESAIIRERINAIVLFISKPPYRVCINEGAGDNRQRLQLYNDPRRGFLAKESCQQNRHGVNLVSLSPHTGSHFLPGQTPPRSSSHLPCG